MISFNKIDFQMNNNYLLYLKNSENIILHIVFVYLWHESMRFILYWWKWFHINFVTIEKCFNFPS